MWVGGCRFNVGAELHQQAGVALAASANIRVTTTLSSAAAQHAAATSNAASIFTRVILKTGAPRHELTSIPYCTAQPAAQDSQSVAF
jgi:hypothetical protein